MSLHYTVMSRIGTRLDSNSSSKAHNRACKLRSRSSNIIYHLKGRSELRDAFTCESGFER